MRSNAVIAGADAAAHVAARDVLATFAGALGRWDPSTRPHGPALDIGRVAPEVVDVVDRMLGEGDIGVVVDGARSIRARETLFTGVWRVHEVDGRGRAIADRLEAGALPPAVLAAARAAATATIVEAAAMHACRPLGEIAAQRSAPRPRSRASHVVNLTLQMLAASDLAAIERALPCGPVAIVVRGSGNCRVASTMVRDVWRVRFFNDAGAMVLDTVELVDIPDVLVAAPSDLDLSHARLAELVDWMSEACPA